MKTFLALIFSFLPVAAQIRFKDIDFSSLEGAQKQIADAAEKNRKPVDMERLRKPDFATLMSSPEYAAAYTKAAGKLEILHPGILDPETELGKKYDRFFKIQISTKDQEIINPEWPILLADRVARTLPASMAPTQPSVSASQHAKDSVSRIADESAVLQADFQAKGKPIDFSKYLKPAPSVIIQREMKFHMADQTTDEDRESFAREAADERAARAAADAAYEAEIRHLEILEAIERQAETDIELQESYDDLLEEVSRENERNRRQENDRRAWQMYRASGGR